MAVAETRCRERARGNPEVSNTRHDHVPGATDFVGIGGEIRPVAAGIQSPHYALEVIDAIVHHRDHNAPLVEGMPTTRESSIVAASNARANDLNAASTM